jgi:excisionase family DNA binding protein
MTTHEVALVLGISRTKVTRLVWDSAIPYVPIGGEIRFDESDLWNWIEQQKTVAKRASVVP